jgi:DNA (cytosine-5)-methyltransferase 1
MSIRYIDLFSGLGGFRIGFERAASALGLEVSCVMSADIKDAALRAYKENFQESAELDVSLVDEDQVPNFDVLLAGFPCQAFSSAGLRNGFFDTRGTLFFEIERLTRHHRPRLIILENVEGLVSHDSVGLGKGEIGRTLAIILESLRKMGYAVSWQVLDSSEFGLPQKRRRVFIVATLAEAVSLNDFPKSSSSFGEIAERGLEPQESPTIKKLLEHFSPSELEGKSLKDKRGGGDNIHSWDIGLKGEVSEIQKELLSTLLKIRRYKKWAERKGIAWMDGMPLTCEEISEHFPANNLCDILQDLVDKNYLSYEHPKDRVQEGGIWRRQQRLDLPKGYNIVAGKLSFEVSKFIGTKDILPTLVATDVSRIAVILDKQIRRLSKRELLRAFGFPETYSLDTVTYNEACDLLGNSIAVPVVEAVAKKALASAFSTSPMRLDRDASMLVT